MEGDRETTERQARVLRQLIDQAPDVPASAFASSSARARSTDRSTLRTSSQTESVQEEEFNEGEEEDSRGRRAPLVHRRRAFSSGGAGSRTDAVRAVGDWTSLRGQETEADSENE
jgi:hypothetical protein